MTEMMTKAEFIKKWNTDRDFKADAKEHGIYVIGNNVVFMNNSGKGVRAVSSVYDKQTLDYNKRKEVNMTRYLFKDYTGDKHLLDLTEEQARLIDWLEEHDYLDVNVRFDKIDDIEADTI